MKKVSPHRGSTAPDPSFCSRLQDISYLAERYDSLYSNDTLENDEKFAADKRHALILDYRSDDVWALTRALYMYELSVSNVTPRPVS